MNKRLFYIAALFCFLSTLGSDVIGIWPKNADKGDINCTHLTHTAKTLATGDDFGYVKLYKFPVTERYVSFIVLFYITVQ